MFPAYEARLSLCYECRAASVQTVWRVQTQEKENNAYCRRCIAVVLEG